MSDTSLFIASDDTRRTLAEVAAAIFSALGLEETEERFSSNYPPDEHYFVAYASNVAIRICDLDDVKEGYAYHLSLERPTYRRGKIAGPASVTEVADVLCRAGLRAFCPIGNWTLMEWDGGGVEYAPIPGRPFSAPPPVLAGLYVVEHAEADESIIFEQRRTLNVDGQWLGRVPRLAICQDFDTHEYAIQHCTENWEPLGIASNYASIEEAKAAIERSYHGIRAKWTPSDTSFDAARALNDSELRAGACSFCGRTRLQAQTMIGDAVRICGQCIDEFHAAIHTRDRAT
jgi:hypothetical protein